MYLLSSVQKQVEKCIPKSVFKAGFIFVSSRRKYHVRSFSKKLLATINRHGRVANPTSYRKRLRPLRDEKTESSLSMSFAGLSETDRLGNIIVEI